MDDRLHLAAAASTHGGAGSQGPVQLRPAQPNSHHVPIVCRREPRSISLVRTTDCVRTAIRASGSDAQAPCVVARSVAGSFSPVMWCIGLQDPGLPRSIGTSARFAMRACSYRSHSGSMAITRRCDTSRAGRFGRLEIGRMSASQRSRSSVGFSVATPTSQARRRHRRRGARRATGAPLRR